jgi:hypothetical protein
MGQGSLSLWRERLRDEIPYVQGRNLLRSAGPEAETVRFDQNRRFLGMSFRLFYRRGPSVPA